MKTLERGFYEENLENSNHVFIVVKPWIYLPKQIPSQGAIRIVYLGNVAERERDRERDRRTEENHRLRENLITHNVNAAFLERGGCTHARFS